MRNDKGGETCSWMADGELNRQAGYSISSFAATLSREQENRERERERKREAKRISSGYANGTTIRKNLLIGDPDLYRARRSNPRCSRASSVYLERADLDTPPYVPTSTIGSRATCEKRFPRIHFLCFFTLISSFLFLIFFVFSFLFITGRLKLFQITIKRAIKDR